MTLQYTAHGYTCRIYEPQKQKEDPDRDPDGGGIHNEKHWTTTWCVSEEGEVRVSGVLYTDSKALGHTLARNLCDKAACVCAAGGGSV